MKTLEEVVAPESDILVVLKKNKLNKSLAQDQLTAWRSNLLPVTYRKQITQDVLDHYKMFNMFLDMERSYSVLKRRVESKEINYSTKINNLDTKIKLVDALYNNKTNKFFSYLENLIIDIFHFITFNRWKRNT